MRNVAAVKKHALTTEERFNAHVYEAERRTGKWRTKRYDPEQNLTEYSVNGETVGVTCFRTGFPPRYVVV